MEKTAHTLLIRLKRRRPTGTLEDLLSLPALFLLGYALLYLRAFISLTVFSTMIPDAADKCMLIAGLAFISMYILTESRGFGGKVFLFLLLMVLEMVCYQRSGETAPLIATSIVIASAPVRDRRGCVRLWFVVTASLTLFLIIAYFLNMLFDPASLTFTGRNVEGEAVDRLSFYFGHPNTVAAVLMMLTSAFLYLSADRIGFRHIIGCETVAAFILLTTQSRTSFAIAAFVPVLYWLQLRFNLFNQGDVRLLVSVAPLVLTLLTYGLAGPLYSDSIASWFTSRIALWHACLLTQGITLLGQRFIPTQSVTGWYTTLDNFYATSLFVFGIVFLAFFIWLFLRRLRHHTSVMAWEAPALLAMLVFGFTEVHIVSPVICFPLLLLGDGLAGKPKYADIRCIKGSREVVNTQETVMGLGVNSCR